MYKLKDRICKGQLCISYLNTVVDTTDVPLAGECEDAIAMGYCLCLGSLKYSSF